MLRTSIRSQFFVLILLGLVYLMSAQRRGYKWEFGIGTGFANYLGEIGGREKAARPWIMDMKMAKTRISEMIYAKYRFDPLFAVRFALNYNLISGEDRLSINEGRKYRNLSFRNNIWDFETTIHWYIYNSKKPMGIYSRSNAYFTAYIFAGVGAFHHNPKTKYQGSWVNLQPLQTEGVLYSKWGYCLPFGAGFYITINKRRRSHRIGLEVNWRYTNTDYLDDISTVYKDPSLLSSATAVALSNRNPEVDRQPDGFEGNYGWHGLGTDGQPVNKAPRGDPSDKDSFISFNVTYAVALKMRPGKFRRSKGRRIRTVTF